MVIREATQIDVDAVEQGYIELLTYEKEHGSTSNWVLGIYPTRAVAEKSCLEKTLYVLLEDNAMCASMILNQFLAEEYQKIEWLYPANSNEVLVIHTLCIPPARSGKGFGKEMVNFAIAKAQQMHCKTIRLDTWAENKPAISFYKKLGFQYAGKANVLLQGVIPEEQVFLEREIKA
jgi:ribosomal protein S18 acetylase RimI-like enzyme